MKVSCPICHGEHEVTGLRVRCQGQRVSRANGPASDLSREEARARRERWETMFALQVKTSRVLPKPERQVRFHPEREWRLDFGWPDLRLAVEIEGLVPDGLLVRDKCGVERALVSRHQTLAGMTEDLVKYNAALVLGWRVLRVSQAHVRSGEALAWAEAAAKMIVAERDFP